MNVYIVIWGDGYGHNKIDKVFDNENDAERYASKQCYHFVKEMKVTNADSLCGNCGHDTAYHYDSCSYINCNCQTFKLW